MKNRSKQALPPRNILLFWETFFPEKWGTAFALRGAALAKYLQREDVKVHILAPKKRDIAAEKMMFESSFVERINTHLSMHMGYNFPVAVMAYPFTIAGLIKKLRQLKPDVIIVSAHNPFFALEVLLAAKLYNAKLIFDVQDSWLVLQQMHPSKEKLKNKIRTFVEGWVCRRTNLIFTVSPTLSLMLAKEYKLDKEKIKVIANCVDLEQLTISQKEPKSIDCIHIGSPRIYYDTPKLIDGLAIAVKMLPSLRVNFVGCLDEPYTKMVREKVRKINLSNNVVFFPYLPREKVNLRLASSKIALYSLSNSEISRCYLGTKLFEYLAFGLPVVYLGVEDGDVAKLIREENVGLVASDINQFAESLISLLRDDKKREMLSNNALKTARRFDWSRVAKEAYHKYILPLLC